MAKRRAGAPESSDRGDPDRRAFRAIVTHPIAAAIAASASQTASHRRVANGEGARAAAASALTEISKKLHGVTPINALLNLNPEYWYYSK